MNFLRDIGRFAFGIAASSATLALLAMPAVVSETQLAYANGDVIFVSSSKTTQVKVAKGKPQTIKTNSPFYEIVIGDPEIANVNPLTDKSFYVLGNNLGTTGIALFDENKQLVGTVDIEVTLDTEKLASTIRDNVPNSAIEVKSANGRVVLSGSAGDAVAAETARNIASHFSGEEDVINSVAITSSQQVQLNVRFVEINRQVGRELGTQISAAYMTPAGGISFNTRPKASGEPIIAQLLAGITAGNFSADVAIDALEDRGVARRLAEPNLIARSGERASFLAGGEFPIPVSEEDGKITVSYKKYGVSLDFTPTVLADGLISLDIEPEVSSIDQSSSYQVGNIAIPGFVVRRAKTSVDLKSGQSFMIAGLLQTTNDTSLQGIPGVSKAPVLGALFSSRAYQRRETDLVIIITPYLVKPVDPSKKMVTPADETTPASQVDFFVAGVDETKTSASKATASFGMSAPLPKPTVGHFLDLSE